LTSKVRALAGLLERIPTVGLPVDASAALAALAVGDSGRMPLDVFVAAAKAVDDVDWDGLPAQARWVAAATVALAAMAAGVPDPGAERTARAYLGWRWSEQDESSGAPVRVDSHQFADFVSDDALVDAAAALCVVNDVYRLRADAVLIEAGSAGLVDELTRRVRGMRQAAADVMVANLGRNLPTDPTPVQVARALHAALGALRSQRLDDHLVSAWDRARVLVDAAPQNQALLLGVLGAALKDARRPLEFLELAGETPQDWEEELAPYTRVTLVVERSNALDLAGKSEAALQVLRSIARSDLDAVAPEARRQLRRNAALIHRRTGAPDAALNELVLLLDESESDAERLGILQPLANTAQFVGKPDLARSYLRQATEIVGASPGLGQPGLQASLAVTAAVLGESLPDDVVELLASSDPLVVTAICGAVVAALEQGNDVATGTIKLTLERLDQVGMAAQRSGDQMVWLNALRGRAALLDLMDPDAAADAWAELVELRDPDHPDPLEHAALAHHRLRVGRAEEARALLRRIPQALSLELGRAADIGTVVDATGRLRAQFRLLGDDVLRATPRHVADIRLVAELRRDALGQVFARARAGGDEVLLPDEGIVMAQLADEGQRLWVLEWLETTTGLVGLLSAPSGTGPASLKVLPRLDIQPGRLADTLRYRANTWMETDPRDPFDVPAWRATVDWLVAALQDARAGDHLVMIEHEAVSGLPWHAIDNVPWTISYNAGWTAIARSRALPRRPYTKLGLTSVPARGDSSTVVEAFEAARNRALGTAAARQLSLQMLNDGAADTASFVAQLHECDLVTFNGHGLLNAGDLDVAFLVAADEKLPPQGSHEINLAPRHQLSWRDLQSVRRSPPLLLSAACSSGTSVMSGLGERFGFHAVLRHAGTRTVIAPAWDGRATDIPAQLDQVREHILDGQPAAAAVKAVADAARADLPNWRARALAVEGDWT